MHFCSFESAKLSREKAFNHRARPETRPARSYKQCGESVRPLVHTVRVLGKQRLFPVLFPLSRVVHNVWCITPIQSS